MTEAEPGYAGLPPAPPYCRTCPTIKEYGAGPASGQCCYWLLVTCYWQLITGYWQLTTFEESSHDIPTLSNATLPTVYILSPA